MSQHQIILNILNDGAWHCSSEFYASFIADPRTRLCELQKKGFQLENKKCELHSYHKGHSKAWKLTKFIKQYAVKDIHGNIEKVIKV